MNLLAQWHVEQDRLERRRWACSAGAILSAIALLLLVMHWHPIRPLILPPPAMPLVVEFAPAPQAPAEPSAQPPGPRQQEAARPQPVQPRIEVPELTPVTAADIALPPISLPAPDLPPQQLPPAPATSAPPGERAPISDHSAAPQQGARVLANPAVQSSFRDRLLGHLQRHKRYPRAAQARGRQGVPQIRFTMDRQGRVLSSSLERGSGHEALDGEALALVLRAQPLPPPPDELGGDSLEIVVPIEFLLRR